MKKTTTKVATRAKKSTKQPAKQRVAVFTTGADVLNAGLIISLLINLFVLCIWITLNLTNQYDQALFDFFVKR